MSSPIPKKHSARQLNALRAIFAALHVLLPALLLGEQQFRILLPESIASESVTGRVILLISKSDGIEPRLQNGFSGQAFAMDVEEWSPGHYIELNETTFGHPSKSLSALPKGNYTVQAVCDVYRQFDRADGHRVWLPEVDWGGGQNPGTKTGDLYCSPVQLSLDPEKGYTHEIALSQTVSAKPPLADTKWIRRIKIQSKVLSEFWGRPVFIGAVVSLPKGYADNPDTFYPVNYQHGWGGLSSGGLEEGTPLFDEWMSDDFPRMIAVRAYMPSPYFGNGHAVNSANMGPWGDAYMKELVPHIESTFRIIREPWARTLSGDSTGGWIVLALQLHHPRFFGGMWCVNPDPVDFRRLGLINIYEDHNAFLAPGGRERSLSRDVFGQTTETVREAVLLEQAYGSKGRSRGQLDAYHALFGPVGEDGYPIPLWDAETGAIDKTIAEYWRNHYDLRHYLEMKWGQIGPDLVGKLHFFCGEMDHFFANEALYGVEEFLESAKSPSYNGKFVWGRPRKGHGWTPWNSENGELFRIMYDHIKASAPPNADKWE